MQVAKPCIRMQHVAQFSTVAVDVVRTSLWKSIASACACATSHALSRNCAATARHGFPQRLWMPCGQACGKASQVPVPARLRTHCRETAQRLRGTVFHSACGCGADKPVEKHRKCLCLRDFARTVAKLRSDCAVRFSTALVDAVRTSLWISIASACACNASYALSRYCAGAARRAEGFPQHLWMPCGQACGKASQVLEPATAGTRCRDSAQRSCAANLHSDLG
jgi:hypothetical protein